MISNMKKFINNIIYRYKTEIMFFSVVEDIIVHKDSSIQKQYGYWNIQLGDLAVSVYKNFDGELKIRPDGNNRNAIGVNISKTVHQHFIELIQEANSLKEVTEYLSENKNSKNINKPDDLSDHFRAIYKKIDPMTYDSWYKSRSYT